MRTPFILPIAAVALLVTLILPPSAQAQGTRGGGGTSPTPPQTAIETFGRLPLVTESMVPGMLNQISVPEEFNVNVFATPPVMNYPTALAPTPDGSALYVGSDGNGASGAYPGIGRILRLRDTNGDGQADEVKAFVPEIDNVRGLVWYHDRLIVMAAPEISLFFDRNGD